MEWYVILLVLLLIVLTILLGVLIACTLVGQRCTLSIQQRTPNHELTQIQQEEERKKQKRLGSRIKRTFRGSSKTETPLAPVEDVKTVELTFKLGDKQKDDEKLAANQEPTVVLIQKPHLTQAELDERQKKRDALRKKYNL